MEKSWVTDDHNNKLLFVAKANDPGSGEEHHQGILGLQKKLKNLDQHINFEWGYKFYSEEDHGSVVVPAAYDAFRFIFAGYQMPVKEAMKEPSLLEYHFEGISKRLGYTVVPDEALIDQLARVCVSRESFEQAAILLLQNTKNYPKSRHAMERYESFLKKYDSRLTRE